MVVYIKQSPNIINIIINIPPIIIYRLICFFADINKNKIPSDNRKIEISDKSTPNKNKKYKG
ncbi:MAG: hypothetical protein KatS3mg003_0681 [Candidatus Nitrosocaldaceae archaeon]|nr:MAG: hypothetical protein KatS3mg003_0681 [Candidatus Nitrosocaldaceae archaeon]